MDLSDLESVIPQELATAARGGSYVPQFGGIAPIRQDPYQAIPRIAPYVRMAGYGRFGRPGGSVLPSDATGPGLSDSFAPVDRPDLQLGPLSIPGASVDEAIQQLASYGQSIPVGGRNFSQGLGSAFLRSLLATATAPGLRGIANREAQARGQAQDAADARAAALAGAKAAATQAATAHTVTDQEADLFPQLAPWRGQPIPSTLFAEFAKQGASQHVVTADDAKAYPGLAKSVGKPIPNGLFDQIVRDDAESQRPQPVYDATGKQVMNNGQPVMIPKGAHMLSPTANAPALDAQTIDWAAKYVLQGGKISDVLSGFGQNIGAAKMKIVQRMAQISTPTDPLAARAQYVSDSHSLGNLQKLLDSATAFSTTATKNTKLLMDAMQKITDTGSPIFNTPVRMLQGRVLGSPEMAAFETARDVVVPEYSRLLSSPGATGALTDESKRQGNNMIAGNLTIPQMIQTIAMLQRDAGNKTESYQQQVDTIRERIKNGQAEFGSPEQAGKGLTPNPGPVAPPIRYAPPPQGKVQMLTPDGRGKDVPARMQREMEAKGWRVVRR